MSELEQTSTVGPHATIPAPSRKSWLVLVKSWSLRGSAAGLLLWVGLWTLNGFRAFMPASIPAEPQLTSGPEALLATPDLSSGAWRFLNEACEISAEVLSNQEAEQRIRIRPGGGASDPVWANQFAGLWPLIKAQGHVLREGEYWRHSLKGLGFQVVGWSRDQDARELVSIRWLIPLDESQSWLVEQRTVGGGTSSPVRGTSMLPPSIDSRLLAQREDASGRTYSQLLAVQNSLDEVLDKLRREGWQIKVLTEDVRSEFVTIHVSRPSAAFWMVVTPDTNTKSLRVMLLQDNSGPSDFNPNTRR